MSKYASLLFSPKEWHIIEPFRFPVYKDLIPGEAKEVELLAKKQARHTFSTIRLAQKIAKERDVTVEEGIRMLSNVSDDQTDIFYKYNEELEELQELTTGVTDQKIALVTLIIRLRGEVMLPDSDSWQSASDWTPADTEAMPPKLLNDIYAFVTWERDGWPDPAKKAEAALQSAPGES